MATKVLIISHNEICYNPRLLKAADYFYERGISVEVFNPIVGIAEESVYRNCINRREWTIIENDIRRKPLFAYLKWVISSLLHEIVRFTVDKLDWKIFSSYYLNKGLFFAPKLNNNYDFVLIHLVDNLPFASKVARKNNAKLIYDSQEYFVGQYQAFEKNKFEWVKNNQEEYINEVDVLVTTTEVMRKQLIQDYNLSIPSVVVRNVPYQVSEFNVESTDSKALKIVWHGMGIYFENRRGLHIVLKAIALVKSDVRLFLQGKFPEQQQRILSRYVTEYNLEGKIEIVPPADPDKIVESLVNYDVGVAPELPIERNQELTSSNKLFDYIHANLAVLASNVLGLRETIDEFEVGLLFKPGDEVELASHIDKLAQNRVLLDQYKLNSKNSKKELTWTNEYDKLFEVMNY